MADATDLRSLPWLELARLVHAREASRREVLASLWLGVGRGQAALFERERGA